MNTLLTEFGDNLRELHQLQKDLLAQLDDNNLALSLPGNNPTLGEVLREMGEWQRRYIESFRTFRQDYSLRQSPPNVATSVEALKVWYAELETELIEAVGALTEEDLQKPVDRGGFTPSASTQFHIYREMLLIYYGRLDVYVRALDRTISDQWRMWVG
ncbi:MAG TPA: DinB family protein [Candidatus Limnocylindrales bacterium]|nr:DinB family protein [Candidatus Limnocylindrales bacterium]